MSVEKKRILLLVSTSWLGLDGCIRDLGFVNVRLELRLVGCVVVWHNRSRAALC